MGAYELNKEMHIGIISVDQNQEMTYFVEGGDVISTMFPSLESLRNTDGIWYAPIPGYLESYQPTDNILGLGSSNVIAITRTRQVSEFQGNNTVPLVNTASLKTRQSNA